MENNISNTTLEKLAQAYLKILRVRDVGALSRD